MLQLIPINGNYCFKVIERNLMDEIMNSNSQFFYQKMGELQRFPLLSVSDKTDIIPLANSLIGNNIKLIASGGTAKLLRSNNLAVQYNHLLIHHVIGFLEMYPISQRLLKCLVDE